MGPTSPKGEAMINMNLQKQIRGEAVLLPGAKNNASYGFLQFLLGLYMHEILSATIFQFQHLRHFFR